MLQHIDPLYYDQNYVWLITLLNYFWITKFRLEYILKNIHYYHISITGNFHNCKICGIRYHAGWPIRLPWDKHNAPLLLFTWTMFILTDSINIYVLESIPSSI